MQSSALDHHALDIVIVTWNSSRTIEPCLQALQNHRTPHSRVIVVDNASQDDTPRLLRLHEDEISHLILNAANVGFAAGCNLGARASDSPVILFLNPDCEVQAETLPEMLALLNSHWDVVAVGARLVGRDGLPQIGFCVRSLPRPIDFWFEALMVNQAFPRNRWNKRYRLLDFSLDSDAEVEQPAGASLMIRRSAFESIGGFDEHFYPAWFEDVDLCRRLKSQNQKIFFRASAIVLHVGGSSVNAMPAGRSTEFFFLNMLRYSRKHFGSIATLLLRAALVFGGLTRWLAISVSSAALSKYYGENAGNIRKQEVYASLRRSFWGLVKGAMWQWRL